MARNYRGLTDMSKYYRHVEQQERRRARGIHPPDNPLETLAGLKATLEQRLKTYPPEHIMVAVIKEAIAIQEERIRELCR